MLHPTHFPNLDTWFEDERVFEILKIHKHHTIDHKAFWLGYEVWGKLCN
jgi:hypothetical protein